MPQHVHVIDAVRPGGHPRDQARHLQIRVHPGPAGDRDMLADQARQATALRQRHDRDQARPRHEIRVIKRRVRLQQIMRQSHLRGVLSAAVMEASVTPIVPAKRAPFASPRPDEPLFTRWIEAKACIRYRSFAAVDFTVVLSTLAAVAASPQPCLLNAPAAPNLRSPRQHRADGAGRSCARRARA